MGKRTPSIITEQQLDPAIAAKNAGLRYVHDDAPGYTRKMADTGFKYLDTAGKVIRDKKTLERIKGIVIPPAYQNVWICPSPNGHIQATGTDARGRKQYKYHPQWREVRDENKYARLLAFGRALPQIRRATKRHLKERGLPRAKVLAAIVQLLEKTMIRVGNEQYAKDNNSYGLTTMLNRHAEIKGERILFDFKGKSGIRHRINLKDAALARIVSRLQDLPGQELFQYVDEEGAIHSATSSDVNEYLKEITGEDFTAKDFRTWTGTVLASMALQEFEKFDSQAQAKTNVVRAIENVAECLGNTPSVCRKCYIHPAVLDSYLDGTMLDSMRQETRRQLKALRGLAPEEGAVLALLGQRLESEASHTSRRNKETSMPRGDKDKYTDKQKRQAQHIEEGYEDRGVPKKEAEARAWATVNAMTGGGKKSGSGRGKGINTAPAEKGGRKGGKAAAARPAAEKTASAKKAAKTRAHHEAERSLAAKKSAAKRTAAKKSSAKKSSSKK